MCNPTNDSLCGITINIPCPSRENVAHSLDVSLTYLCTLRLWEKQGIMAKKVIRVRNWCTDFFQFSFRVLCPWPEGCGSYHFENLQSFSSIILRVSEKWVRHIYTDWQKFLSVYDNLCEYVGFSTKFGSIRLSRRFSCILKYLFSSCIDYQKKKTTAERRLRRYRRGLSTKRIQYHKHWDGRKKTNIKKETTDV